jgi:transposase
MLTESGLFAKALNVESPWYVSEVRFDPSGGRLDIFVDFERGSTFYYKDEELGVEGHFKAYDTEEKVWRHLNFFQFECYLHAWVPRVDVGNGKVRRVKASWEGVSNGFTLLFEAFLLQLCRAMTPHQVGEMTGVSDQRLWSMLGSYVTIARSEEDFESVFSICLDETAARRGHDYVTIFADSSGRRSIFVTQGKGAEAVAAFSRDLEAHGGKIENITQVSCDMSPAFIKGITENFPEADIYFDRFHVMAVLQKGVDQVRREEVQHNPILKKARYAILKNKENLTEKQAKKLEELKLSKLNLKTMRAMAIREAFQQIYQAETPEQFEMLLKKWYFWATHSRLEPIIEAASTIRRHWYGIITWAKSKLNNGLMEGINSVFQAAKAKARGYKKTETIITVIYLLTGKLDFSKVNPYCGATHTKS